MRLEPLEGEPLKVFLGRALREIRGSRTRSAFYGSAQRAAGLKKEGGAIGDLDTLRDLLKSHGVRLVVAVEGPEDAGG
jgi:hypothetical protein